MTSRLRPGLRQHTRFCVDFIICGIQEIHAASQHKYREFRTRAQQEKKLRCFYTV